MPEARNSESGEPDFDTHVTTFAALGEPVRRALYQFVARQAEPMGREQAANEVGVPWHVAKFHLDRLEQDGLLDVEFRRPSGRSGPGAGRPTKLYRRSSRQLSVSLPERRYALAGRIMASAITATQSGSASLVDGPREAAREVLDDYGHESRVEKGITLANCPFHSVAQEYTELVCGMNLDLLRGVLDSLGAERVEARLDPSPGRCCVMVYAQ